jgi:dihydropteroate synthase
VFGPQAAQGEGFVVPHAGLPERPFALLPLADVWPDWHFPAGPLAGRSASALAEPWRAEPAHVPLRTTRTPLALTEIVAAVNITPDSFSEGGRFVDPARAADHALRMVHEGADVLDIGGESTRPGGAPIDQAEEWRRLGPVLERLTKGIDRPVSVDTRHAGTARRAIDAGARWINDVTGLTAADMVALARGSGVDLVVMHSLTIPPSRDATLPPDRNPVTELRRWGAERLSALEQQGIAPTRIILDPGIGFGKTAGQSTAVMRDADLFGGLGVRTLVGHSRKSFLASWFPADHPAARDPMARELETALLASHCSLLGVDYVRVHDVAGARRALRAAALVGPSILRPI